MVDQIFEPRVVCQPGGDGLCSVCVVQAARGVLRGAEDFSWPTVGDGGDVLMGGVEGERVMMRGEGKQEMGRGARGIFIILGVRLSFFFRSNLFVWRRGLMLEAAHNKMGKRFLSPPPGSWAGSVPGGGGRDARSRQRKDFEWVPLGQASVASSPLPDCTAGPKGISVSLARTKGDRWRVLGTWGVYTTCTNRTVYM